MCIRDRPEAAAPEEVEAETIEDDVEGEEPEEDPVEAAKAEADAWRDKYFRLHAESVSYTHLSRSGINRKGIVPEV